MGVSANFSLYSKEPKEKANFFMKNLNKNVQWLLPPMDG